MSAVRGTPRRGRRPQTTIVYLLLTAWFTVQPASTSLGRDTIHVEGENYSRVGGPSKIRVVERDSASQGRVVSYWEEEGVWIEWAFKLPKAGSYAVSVRYACRWPDTRRRVEIDDRLPNKACESVRFDGTGDWAKHAVHTLSNEKGVPLVLSLQAGEHRMRMTNVNSRGLAVDVIFIHDPARKFADVALTESEAAPFKARMPTGEATEPKLDEAEMRMGRVRAAFEDGALGSVWVADTLFLAPAAARRSQEAGVAAPVRLDRTSGLLMRLQRRRRRWELYLTDGHAFYAVVASREERPQRIPLWPSAYAKDGRVWEPVLWRDEHGAPHMPREAAPRPCSQWQVGRCRIYASPDVSPNQGMELAGASRVAVLKFCPLRWTEDGLAAEVKSKAGRDEIRSSARDYPGLAAFYEYGRFRVQLEWAGQSLKRCLVEDLSSGEHSRVWGKRR